MLSQDGFTAEAVINSQPTCGEANGSVTIVTTGGVGPFAYDWGATDTEIDLAAGTFEVTEYDLLTNEYKQDTLAKAIIIHDEGESYFDKKSLLLMSKK